MPVTQSIRNIAPLVLGVIFGIVGVVGFILPLVPETPFLLIAAACFNSREPEEISSVQGSESLPVA
ncbi:DUF454 family protein [uncultured Thermosynechococcus sp.]|uniref:DUF454 family protein n=1 Tax=uncultured Thermosynechococcus sp. TaxID=436945 RepID=UPI002612B5D2|nr:DUF454 family protein [uncultured Thermosynechococcus sp.]